MLPAVKTENFFSPIFLIFIWLFEVHFDFMSVPNSLNVRTTAGETGMLFGHWFPPHITSLAGYINYIVNVRHSYAVVSIKKYHSMTHFNSSHVYVKLTKYHFVTCITCLLTHLALFCAIQLGFLYAFKK